LLFETTIFGSTSGRTKALVYSVFLDSLSDDAIKAVLARTADRSRPKNLRDDLRVNNIRIELPDVDRGARLSAILIARAIESESFAAGKLI
jgi:hypothetical protein